MYRALVLFLCLSSFRTAEATPRIIDRPIRFDQQRIQLTLDYIKQHYGLTPGDIRIVPRAIVIHWTGTARMKPIWRGFNRVALRSSRKRLRRAGRLNVSAHFIVDRDGKIYRLMPETWMARHCIGLNYDAIGVENVGGVRGSPLTTAQVRANTALVRYLAKKFTTIGYLLGHFEWKNFEKAPFFREQDPSYRSHKVDPGRSFMSRLRKSLRDLGLKDAYHAAAGEGPSTPPASTRRLP